MVCCLNYSVAAPCLISISSISANPRQDHIRRVTASQNEAAISRAALHLSQSNRDPLPHADTHGRQRSFAALALQFQRSRAGDAGSVMSNGFSVYRRSIADESPLPSAA